jgi:adenylate cyclase
MSDGQVEVTRLTSVQLLDAAIWREIGTEEPQPAQAFLEALSTLLGRWLLIRSAAPEMDAVTVLCRVRGYIARHGRARGVADLQGENGESQ